MDNHISNNPNNPINCNDEQDQCNDCQSEMETTMEGFEYCPNCNICKQCGRDKEKNINCKPCNNDNI
tara:strand:- start:178 stop:378 length:201 start_codon:yes stop_codon:yes gene_type:complete